MSFDVTSYILGKKSSSGGGGGGGGALTGHSVKFIDFDGELFSEAIVEDGGSASYPNSVPSDSERDFVAWKTADDLSNVTEDCHVFAKWKLKNYSEDDTVIRVFTTPTSAYIKSFGFRVSEITEEITMTVDWGDGSTDTWTGTSNNTFTHSYENAEQGYYDVVITSTGQYGFSDNFNGGSANAQIVRRIQFGKKVKKVGSAMYSCQALTGVTFLNESTDTTYLNFNGCQQLGCVVLPDSFTFTTNSNNLFSNNKSLKGVYIPSTATSSNGLTGTFNGCYSLKWVKIPKGVSGPLGQNVFGSCASLEKLSIPSGITQVQGLSSTTPYLYSLKSVDFGNVTYLSLGIMPSVKKVVIPKTVTTLVGALNGCSAMEECVFEDGVQIQTLATYFFYGCNTLRKVTLPESLTALPQMCFQNCYALEELTIPSSVTSLGNSLFNQNYALRKLEFKSSTPPTATSSTFSNLITTSSLLTVVVVPKGSLADYQADSNYASLVPMIIEADE